VEEEIKENTVVVDEDIVVKAAMTSDLSKI